MATIVLRCTCSHAFQDKEYGYGMRVHNGCKSGTSGFGWRCTVCGEIQEMKVVHPHERDEE